MDRPEPERAWQTSPGTATDLTMAFSPDGSRLASAGTDGGAWLWDLSSWRLARRLDSPGVWVWGLAFSPDNRLLAGACDDGTLLVWDLEAISLVHSAQTPKPLRSAAFHPDGSELAIAGDDGVVRLWTVGEWELARELSTDSDALEGVAYSPDGLLLAAGGDGGDVQVWSTADLSEVRTLTGEMDRVFTVAFEGEHLDVTGRGGTYDHSYRWRVSDWSIVEHSSDRMDFEDDHDSVFTTSPDGRYHVYTSGDWVSVSTPDGHEHQEVRADVAVHAVALDHTGSRLVACGPAKAVRPGLWLWDATGWRQLGDQVSRSPTLAPDGSMVAVCGDKDVLVWDTRSGALTQRLPAKGWVYRLAFSPDGSVLASHGRAGVIRWDTTTWDRTVDGGEQLNWPTVAFDPDGGILAAGGTGAGIAVLRDGRRTKYKIREVNDAAPMSVPIAFHPDGSTMVFGLPDAVQVWDLATGKVRHRLSGPRQMVSAVAISPDGVLLAGGGADRLIRIWDLATGEPVRTLTGHTNIVYGLAFGPGGRLASCGGDGVRLWDTTSGECRQHLIDGTGGGGWWAVGLHREDADVSNLP